MQSSQIMKKTRQIRKWKRTKKATTTTTTTTTTLVPCLPDEIMFFHILPKVPAKCLLRLNCVSKLWYNTIHDPMFIATYLSHGKSNPSIVALLRTLDHSLHYLHLKEEAAGGGAVAGGHHHLGLRWVSHFPIIGHCNGLTCTRGSSSSDIQISNPTTREILTFPQPSLSLLTKSLCVSFSVHGFGFDSVMNEYKVIQITSDSNKGYHIWVYTLGTNSWRNITATCNYPTSGYHTNLLLPFYTTKALYWMNNEYRNILSFDLHLEKFQLIPCPKDFQAPGLTFCSLYELGGRPSLLFHRKDNLIKDGIELIIYILTNQHSLGQVMHTKQQQPQQGSSWVRVKNCNRLPFKPDKIQISAVSKQLCVQWKTKDGDFIGYKVNQKKIHKKLPGAQQVLLVNHVENLLSLKTFVPVPSAGDFKVKYVSSRKAKHESSTAASSDQLLQQQKKKRRRGVTPCWFPIIF